MSVIITTFKRENVKRPLEGFGVLIPSKKQQNGLRTLGYVLNCSHFYWSKGFPLYGLNYGSTIQAIEKMEKDLPGLFYAGNHKGGLSVGKAISSGWQAADFVISYLGSCSDANQNRQWWMNAAMGGQLQLGEA